MKKLLISLLLALNLYGCGQDTSIKTNSVDGTNPPWVNSTPTVLKHSIYLIGGQSNAVRMLYAMTGINADSGTNTSDLLPNSFPNINGYGVGGTGIDFWLDTSNAAPLNKIIVNNCSKNPYFIWYQGESDAGILKDGTHEYTLYANKLTTFFNSITSICPNITIIEIGIAIDSDLFLTYPDWAQIMQIQRNFGLPYIDANPYGIQFGYALGGDHLYQQGYEGLWNQISTNYPLN